MHKFLTNWFLPFYNNNARTIMHRELFCNISKACISASNLCVSRFCHVRFNFHVVLYFDVESVWIRSNEFVFY